jgi:hypothetical protein
LTGPGVPVPVTVAGLGGGGRHGPHRRVLGTHLTQADQQRSDAVRVIKGDVLGGATCQQRGDRVLGTHRMQAAQQHCHRDLRTALTSAATPTDEDGWRGG